MSCLKCDVIEDVYFAYYSEAEALWSEILACLFKYYLLQYINYIMYCIVYNVVQKMKWLGDIRLHRGDLFDIDPMALILSSPSIDIAYYKVLKVTHRLCTVLWCLARTVWKSD